MRSCLRVLGLDREERFHRYHRVLSRANWSGLDASRVLLGLLIRAFVPDGPLVLGIDETLERREGAKIRAKGIYRDPVRSSREHYFFVKASGPQWVCAMVLVPPSLGLLGLRSTGNGCPLQFRMLLQ